MYTEYLYLYLIEKLYLISTLIFAMVTSHHGYVNYHCYIYLSVCVRCVCGWGGRAIT